MRIEDFLNYDNYQVIFPEFQDDRIKKFANSLHKLCGNQAKVVRKATNKRKKLSYKSKDILHLELRVGIKGLIGLFLCLQEFEELIELRVVRNLLKYNIPKEFRDLFEEHYDQLRAFNKKINEIKDVNEISIDDLSDDLRERLEKIIKQKVRAGT
ncbi:MAG: hypothetical protein ACTSQI_13825 [Candidatus Helarchaeota archaeon]